MHTMKDKPDSKPPTEQMRTRRQLLRRLLRGAFYAAPAVAVLGMHNIAAAQASGPMGGP